MTDDWPMPDHDSGDGDDDKPEGYIEPCPPPEEWEFYRMTGHWRRAEWANRQAIRHHAERGTRDP